MHLKASFLEQRAMTMAAAAAVPLKQVLRGSVVLTLGSKFKSNSYNHYTNLAMVFLHQTRSNS